MESFLNRYRNITVLLLVIFAQLVLLAVQVKNDQDVRVIRVWTITAVTPVARVVEAVRGGTVGFVQNYFALHNADADNRRLREEVGRLKIENIFLKNELNTADRAKALQVFQAKTASKLVAATVIGTGAATGSKMVLVDAGSAAGVQRGMAVVTPDGIVGKVIAAYPTGSEVMLVTDPEFAAGVVSQKTGVRGTLKGQGTPTCKLDYVPIEEKIEVGEMLYTSGDDRIFPRGFPAGIVKVVRNGQPFKEILVEPIGLQHGVDDVLIVVQGVHQEIPPVPPANQPVYIAPTAPPEPKTPAPAAADNTGAPPVGTEADRLRSAYKAVGDAQNHVYGEGLPGSKPPDFTKLPIGPNPASAAPAANSVPVAKPPAAVGPKQVTPRPAAPPQAAPAQPADTPPAAPKQPDSQRKANQAAGAATPAGQGPDH
jgi:rod shape-determining protein MreC